MNPVRSTLGESDLPLLLSSPRSFEATRLLRLEAAQAHDMLYLLLPPGVVERLDDPNSPTHFAESRPDVSILFIKLHNFAARTQSLPPQELVALLNAVFRCSAAAFVERYCYVCMLLPYGSPPPSNRILMSLAFCSISTSEFDTLIETAPNCSKVEQVYSEVSLQLTIA